MQPSQICTDGPAISFRTSRCDLLQNEQRKGSCALSLASPEFHDFRPPNGQEFSGEPSEQRERPSDSESGGSAAAPR